MLCLFFGEDTYRSRECLREFLNDTSCGNESFSPSRFDPDDFDEYRFGEFLRAQNLFAEKYTIICENLLETATYRDFILDNLKFCASSENLFIFREETLESRVLAVFKKHAQKIEEFKSLSYARLRQWLDKELEKRKISIPFVQKDELIRQAGTNTWFLIQEVEKYHLSVEAGFPLCGSPEKEEVNLFHIADAVASRDKARAWLLFQKSLISGQDAEEVFWKIAWQIKNSLLLKGFIGFPENKIAEITRLHPYVVKKNLSASRFFTEEELSRYSLDLVNLYHDSRRGMSDFETGVEKFLINL